MKGLTSGRLEEYLPFISGLFDVSDNLQMLRISKKQERGEELSSIDQMLLTVNAVKESNDKKLSDISQGYRTGKMSAHMVPYMFEILLTAGAFN